VKIPWKEVGKFFYLYVAGLAVPVLDFSLSITPEVSGLRSIVQGHSFFIVFLHWFSPKIAFSDAASDPAFVDLAW
jgi:hypothetical protein